METDAQRKRISQPISCIKHCEAVLTPVVVRTAGKEGSLFNVGGNFPNIGDGPLLCGREGEIGEAQHVDEEISAELRECRFGGIITETLT